MAVHNERESAIRATKASHGVMGSERSAVRVRQMTLATWWRPVVAPCRTQEAGVAPSVRTSCAMKRRRTSATKIILGCAVSGGRSGLLSTYGQHLMSAAFASDQRALFMEGSHLKGPSEESDALRAGWSAWFVVSGVRRPCTRCHMGCGWIVEEVGFGQSDAADQRQARSWVHSSHQALRTPNWARGKTKVGAHIPE